MHILIRLTMEKLSNLFEVDAGALAVVKKVNISDTSKHKRLLELGFCEGVKVKVLKKGKKLLLVGILGCSYCMDSTLASAILVERDIR